MNDRPPRLPALRAAATLAALGLLLPATAAQGRTAAEVRTDVAFARGLAAEWQYVDLAEEVLLEVEAAGVPEELAEELQLAKSDVYAEGAKAESDPVRREELYRKALDSYQEFIDDHPVSDHLAEAQRSFVDLTNRYGLVLARDLEDAVGEEAEELRERIRGALEDALQLTGELVDDLRAIPEPTVAQKTELARMMFARAQMLHTLGQVAEEGVYYLEQALQVLETLALEVGETSIPGLYAYLEMARVYQTMGEPRSAADFAQFVVDVAVPLEDEARTAIGWSDLSPAERQQRWSFAESGVAPLVDAYLSAGEAADATAWALHYYNTWKREGFTLTPYGHLSLLSAARALLDAGGYVGGSLSGGDLRWFETEEAMEDAGFTSRREQRSALDLALSIAQTINEENRGNVLQVRAQKLIADVIDRPGVEVSPDVLFEAAEGVYFDGDHQAAIAAFKRVLRALQTQDEATRLEYGAKVLGRLGDSYRKLGRPLEAAMAYREGVTTWRGDPEFDEKNAQGYYTTMAEVKRRSPGADLYVQMHREAENIITTVSEDTGDIVFRQAKRLYDQDDYQAAREKFLEVERSADTYEKALTYAALSLHKMKDLDAAEAEFRAYVEEFVPDTANAITAPKKVATRQEATAMATFYLGRIAYERAITGAGPFDGVVEHLEGFRERFPGQDEYARNALYMQMMAELALDRFEAARATLDELVAHYPTAGITGTAALKMYKRLEGDRGQLAGNGDGERRQALTREMAELMTLSNELDDEPSYASLRAESEHWMELGEWAKSEAALERLADLHGESEASKVRTFVLPDLGRTRLEQRKVAEAYDVLDPLVPDPDEETDQKPSAALVRTWARAVTGWVEQDGDALVEVPGVGGKEDLEDAVAYLVQLTAREDSYSCPWYALVFETAYANRQLGRVDTAKREAAVRLLDRLRSDVGPELRQIGEECGEDLRQRLLWLWNDLQ